MIFTCITCKILHPFYRPTCIHQNIDKSTYLYFYYFIHIYYFLNVVFLCYMKKIFGVMIKELNSEISSCNPNMT